MKFTLVILSLFLVVVAVLYIDKHNKYKDAKAEIQHLDLLLTRQYKRTEDAFKLAEEGVAIAKQFREKWEECKAQLPVRKPRQFIRMFDKEEQ